MSDNYVHLEQKELNNKKNACIERRYHDVLIYMQTNLRNVGKTFLDLYLPLPDNAHPNEEINKEIRQELQCNTIEFRAAKML